MRNPEQSRAWVSGYPACGRVAAGGPAGGAADRAAPASSLSPQVSRASGPPKSVADTGRSALPSAPPCDLPFHLHLERNRDATEFFRVWQETWNTSVRFGRARSAPSADSRWSPVSTGTRVSCFPAQSQVSSASCIGATPHSTPHGTLFPTLNPKADRLVPGLHCSQQKPRQQTPQSRRRDTDRLCWFPNAN